jgi:hypothetical protein
MLFNRLEMRYEDFAPFFEYKDGQLIRKISSKRSHAGDVVGVKMTKGYLTVGHMGKYWMAHRIVYLLKQGTCPDFIDHINGIKDDNRIENLREADISTNHYNCKTPVHNTSGAKGVHKLKRQTGYQARINFGGKRKYLGTFPTFELADEFVSLARELLHGDFANHGNKEQSCPMA